MAWKGATAKYKHATTKVTRTEWYTDLSVADITSDSARGIKASNKFIAFNHASGGKFFLSFKNFKNC